MIVNERVSGVCAREITLIVENNTINGIRIGGGCDGQGKALNALCSGMPLEWVRERLHGLECHGKGTSCAAKIADIIDKIKGDENENR